MEMRPEEPKIQQGYPGIELLGRQATCRSGSFAKVLECNFKFHRGEEGISPVGLWPARAMAFAQNRLARAVKSAEQRHISEMATAVLGR